MHAGETDLLADALYGEVRVAHAVLHDSPQFVDEGLVLRTHLFLRLAFLLVLLAAEDVAQLFARAHQVVDACREHRAGERFCDVRVGTRLVTLLALVVEGACREENDGDVARHGVVLQLACELQSVHDGHHDVRDDQFGHLAPCAVQSAASVGSLDDVVLLFEDRLEVGAHAAVVVDDEDEGFGICFLRLRDACRLLRLRVYGKVRVVVHGVVYDDGAAVGVACLVEVGLRGGQCDAERGAALLVGGDNGLSVVHVSECLYQCQSDARATDGTLRLVEAVEEVRQFSGVDIRPCVVHLQRADSPVLSDSDGDGAARRCVLHGVRHEVEENVRHFLAVGDDAVGVLDAARV